MRLARDSWLPLAKALRPGERRRVAHDCGEGTPLMIEHTARGLRAWCHRCGEGDGVAAPEPSPAERLARMREAAAGDAAIQRAGVALPDPKVHDVAAWPHKGRLWLYKAGLSRGDIGDLGAYFHPPSGRVVLPVWQDGRAVFWQARKLDPGGAKYLSPPVDKAAVVPRWGTGPTVLTEDILSAFKVGRVAHGVAMLGTKPSAGLIAYLQARRAEALVWLDPDKAGHDATVRVVRTLHKYGLAARPLKSARDPKLHTFDQIKEIVFA